MNTGTGANRRLLTLSCYLSLMCYSFAVAGWGPCVSMMQKSFHIRDAGIGALRTSLFTGFTISVFAAGYIMQRFGEKRIAIAGPCLMGITLIGFSMSRGYAAALCALAGAGLAAGLLEAAVNTIVSEMGGERRAQALNTMHIFFGVGAFCASRGAGLLFQGGGSWRTLYAGIGVCAIVASALFIPLAVPSSADETQPKLSSIISFSLKPLILLLGVCIFFYMGYEVGLNDWIVPYLERFFKSFGADKKSATDLLAWFWISIAAGRFACSIAARRIKPAVMLSLITGLTTVTAIFIFIVKNPAAIGALVTLSAFFSAGIVPTILAIGGNSYPRNVGTVNGIIMGFVGIATILFPIAIGIISDRFDLKVAMVAVCSFLIAMLISALLAWRYGAAAEAGAA